MSVVVTLFLVAPLVLVPLGYRLLEVAAPGSRPPAIVLRVVVPAAGALVVSFWLPAGPAAVLLALPWLTVTGITALAAGLRLLRAPDRFHPSLRHAVDAARPGGVSLAPCTRNRPRTSPLRRLSATSATSS